jgi:hypothetical protein
VPPVSPGPPRVIATSFGAAPALTGRECAMRYARPVTFLLNALLLIGCSQGPSATAPSGLGLTASSSVNSATALATAGVVSNTIIPIPPNSVLFDACTGEGVHVTGTIHRVTVTTVDANGGTHMEMHFNVQGVSGVGLVTGTQYRGIHTETHSSNASGSGASEFTTVIDIKLIAEGSADNLTIRDVLIHSTTNADGTVTANIDNMTIGECR